MSQLSLSSFANRKTLKDIVKVPKSVQSVYSLTQHVWAGKNGAERQESKKKNRVRLETLKERENQEKKAGPGARLDALWRKKIEGKRIFLIVFSLEGSGGVHEKKLEDFILEEAQTTWISL